MHDQAGHSALVEMLVPTLHSVQHPPGKVTHDDSLLMFLQLEPTETPSVSDVIGPRFFKSRATLSRRHAVITLHLHSATSALAQVRCDGAVGVRRRR